MFILKYVHIDNMCMRQLVKKKKKKIIIINSLLNWNDIYFTTEFCSVAVSVE